MGHLGWLFKLNPHPRHQHCTDEAQKAETVLSAVSYLPIYISKKQNLQDGQHWKIGEWSFGQLLNLVGSKIPVGEKFEKKKRPRH